MKTNTSLPEKRILRCGGLVFCVMVTVLCLGLVGNASAASYNLTLTSSGAQSINATGAGGAVISSDSINVATTCKSGYSFTINTSVNDNNLYLGGDASQNESGKYFTPADGTTTLANSTNTWGYYYNATNPSTAPTSSNIFSPVPTLDSPATVISPRVTPSSTDINDNFNIYYGVSVSPSMPVGTYKMIPEQKTVEGTEILVDGTIVYTATIAEACTKYTVHFDPSSYFEGNLITGTGTMSDQSIFEGASTALTSNGFTAPSGYYFAGWNTAQDGSGTTYTNGQSVTDLTTAGNTINLYAMWTDCPGGNICYSANVANPSDVTGTMGDQEFTKARDWSSCEDTDYESYCYDSNGDEVDINTLPELDYYSNTLWASNFKRAGYGFAGWNDKYDYSGTYYGPNQDITAPADVETNGLSLYAVWIKSAGSLQNWDGCSSLAQGSTTALTDERDGNTYAVAKLADGKCWTIENFRLADKDASNNDIELSSTNTHNPSLPFTNIYNADSSQATTSNHLSATTDPTTTAWCTSNSAACDDQSMLATNNTTLFTGNTSTNYSASSNVYSYGNYYNWYSATAGHGKYGSSYGSGYTAPGDICPAGWHLPTGNTTGEYYALNTALNAGATDSTASNGLRSYPNNFVYSGYVDGSSVYYRGSDGGYWSSSAYNSSRAYYLYFGSSYVSPGTTDYYKYYGRVARCVSGV